MCIVINPTATLSDTIAYAGEVQHPTEGVVHVVGYQNTVTGSGPNAMLLPLPTDEPLSPENVLDTASEGLTGALKGYHEFMVMLNQPRGRRSKSRDFSLEVDSLDSYQVFDSGSYTIALAESAAGLTKALRLVPTDKRPEINTHFLEELSKAYPKTPIALCCFNGTFKAEPLFWWYKPRNPEVVTIPAIDAHDGGPPKDQLVHRDHTLVFGSYRAEGLRSATQLLEIPNHWAITKGVVVSHISKMRTPNGDFTVPISGILNTDKQIFKAPQSITVQKPPGWAA